VRTVAPDASGLAEAAAALLAGEVVAYPTETVYGLAVDPFSEGAIDRLFAAKGRPESNPILLIVADEGQLARVAAEISMLARRCIDGFWPGPLSLLFPKTPDLPLRITAGGNSVCVRCPGSVIARDLCRAFGGPLTSTSANRSGEPPARAFDELELDGVALALDGGRLGDAPPSTVYDPETDRVLREGGITAAQLRALLQP
jgi:L-threonylcarbamoyladenylate synthase